MRTEERVTSITRPTTNTIRRISEANISTISASWRRILQHDEDMNGNGERERNDDVANAEFYSRDIQARASLTDRVSRKLTVTRK